MWSPWSLLHAEQPLSQPVFSGEVLQPFDNLHHLPLDSHQEVHVLILGDSELATAYDTNSGQFC